jgi:hypothetical protein
LHVEARPLKFQNELLLPYLFLLYIHLFISNRRESLFQTCNTVSCGKMRFKYETIKRKLFFADQVGRTKGC